jgi:hypothetical protein
MLVSVHIPKCAGTSFRHILQEQYGDELWLNYGSIFVRSQARAELIPSGTACVHGHFFADAFDDVAADRQLITWVRHPVERVVSNYYHFQRSPDMRDDCCREMFERKLSLTQFAGLDWMRNEATRYLAGKKIDDFAFVGIAERFTESLHLLGAKLGWSDAVAPRRDNINPNRRYPHYQLSRDDFELIRELNAVDMALYEDATARLARELAVGQNDLCFAG